MRWLIFAAMGGLLGGLVQAAYFEKSPAARLDLDIDEGGSNFYSLSIWLGPDVPVIQLAGTLDKLADGSYRDSSADGNPSGAALGLEKKGDGWQVGFGGGTAAGGKPPYAEVVSGVYSPVSQAEAARHAREHFADLDVRLNANCEALRETLSEAKAKELRGLQRNWIEYRDRMAAAQPAQNGEGDGPIKDAPSYWDMQTSLTRDRIEFLEAWSGRLASSGITGTYRDFFGGEMTLRETKSDLEFTLNVVRGPSFAIGEIAGVAHLKGNKATFDDGETPPAKVEWWFKSDGRVEVKTQNADSYHGARAYFDGWYFKVSGAVAASED